MSRKIYFDYGLGWEDATTYVRDDIVITERMCSDTYRYAQNVANFTVFVQDMPEIPDDPAGQYYYIDDWATEDGWTQTLSESIATSLRGGVYKRDFVTISGNQEYMIRLKAVATGTTQVALVGEKADNSFEVIGVSALAGGESIATFIVNNPETYTGLGFIWDARVNLTWKKLYVGNGSWVSNFDRMVVTSNLKVKIMNDTTQMFQGKIVERPKYSFDGKISSLQVAVEATDSIKDLDVDFDKDTDPTEFVLRDCYIMNPANKALSLVHQLAYLAGKTDADVDDTVSILTTFSGFSNNFSSSSILAQLDTLLYENGYCLHMNNEDKISPIKWLDVSATPTQVFDDTNCLIGVETEEVLPVYEGVRVIYNHLSTMSGVLLYRENLPYNSDGTYLGYWVPSGYYYPIEANVIDDETAARTVVFQEYTENGIKALTNKGIVDKLDFDTRTALGIFKSNYSAIVATSDWALEASYSGLTLVSGEYYNRKAQLLWQNQDVTASGHYIYYANIRGTVLYKDSDSKIVVTTVSGTKKIDEYKSAYLYTNESASLFAKGLMAEHSVGGSYYTIKSDVDVALGTFIQIQAGDIIDCLCIVVQKIYDEQTRYYTYRCKGYSINYASIISTGVTKTMSDTTPDVVSIGLDKYAISVRSDYDGNNPILTDAFITAQVLLNGANDTSNWVIDVIGSNVAGTLIGSTYTITRIDTDVGYLEFTFSKNNYTSRTLRCTVTKIRQGVAEHVIMQIPVYAPVYRNPVAYADLDVTAGNVGDTVVAYATISGQCGIYKMVESTWTKQYPPESYMIAQAWADVTALANNNFPTSGTPSEKIQAYVGTGVTYIETLGANLAFINSLMAEYIKVGAAIYGGDRYNEDGSDNNTSGLGYWQGANGLFKATKAELTDATLTGEIVSRFGVFHTDIEIPNLTLWKAQTGTTYDIDLSTETASGIKTKLDTMLGLFTSYPITSPGPTDLRIYAVARQPEMTEFVYPFPGEHTHLTGWLDRWTDNSGYVHYTIGVTAGMNDWNIDLINNTSGSYAIPAATLSTYITEHKIQFSVVSSYTNHYGYQYFRNGIVVGEEIYHKHGILPSNLHGTYTEDQIFAFFATHLPDVGDVRMATGQYNGNNLVNVSQIARSASNTISFYGISITDAITLLTVVATSGVRTSRRISVSM